MPQKMDFLIYLFATSRCRQAVKEGGETSSIEVEFLGFPSFCNHQENLNPEKLDSVFSLSLSLIYDDVSLLPCYVSVKNLLHYSHPHLWEDEQMST